MLAVFSIKVKYFGEQKTHRSGFLFVACDTYRITVPKFLAKR